MSALLPRIKANLTFHAHRRTTGMLDGDYASVFHGHSLDFDDLREYIPGDEIRDIDWKATARHSEPLVKRYVAHRKHVLTLVVDSSTDFDAASRDGANKRELAVLFSGMAGYLAVRHGDDVCLVHGTAESTWHSPVKASEAHLESLLRMIMGARGSGPGDVSTQLTWVSRHVTARRLLLVVSDASAVIDPVLLRRLAAQHEIMWVTVSDVDLVDPATAAPYDVAGTPRAPLPPALTRGSSLVEEYRRTEEDRSRAHLDALRRAGIAHVGLDNSAHAAGRLLTLMRRQKHGSR